jgi:hypothetical protein
MPRPAPPRNVDHSIALSELLTISQLAARAKWTRLRMWRHLVTANRQLNGMLLVNIARPESERPRWVVALSALKALHPQWFFDPESMQQRIEDLEEENEELRAKVEVLERIQNLHTKALAASRTGTRRVADQQRGVPFRIGKTGLP